MKTKLAHIALGIALCLSSATLAADTAPLDKQTLNDAYVYLIGRAVVSLVDIPGFLAVANPLNRYSFNSIAPPKPEADGALRIYVGPKAGPDVPESNWLPAPAGKPFSLTFRTYVPKDVVKRGEWFPPAVMKVK